MTILESLSTLVAYPIPALTLGRICTKRGLTDTEIYTIAIDQSEAYQLAMADVYMWMVGAPDLQEQDISITPAERDYYLTLANTIYGLLDAVEFTGDVYGFVGEEFNDQ
jgi:hypothetical protein